MRRPGVRFSSVALSALVSCGVLMSSPALAQYQGHNFKGDVGVNSGTQPPPGIFVLVPYGQWNADEIKDADGDRFAASRFRGFDLRLVPLAVVGVTPRKVLGANYGFMVALPLSKIRPELADEAVEDVAWDLTDIYVVPLLLGWHMPRADAIAGYGFYAPTGRYESGASDNTGLGMWSHEIQGGVTLFADPAKTISVATTGFLELHTKKKDLDLKVGALLTLEGGVAYNVPTIGGAFGIAYYLQQKLSDDSGGDFPAGLLGALNLAGRNRVFGIGPDVTMGVFRRGTTAGALNVRYLWDSQAKSSFAGGTFWMSFTLARLRP